MLSESDIAIACDDDGDGGRRGIMITKLGRRVAHVVTMCGVAPEHLTKYFWWQLTKYSALPVKNTRGCP